MSTDLVIARYNEPLDWLAEMPLERVSHVCIYDKGEQCTPPPSTDDTLITSRKILNVGREAHTYLSHIVTHWDYLADWTIFCQGGVIDHGSMRKIRELFTPTRNGLLGIGLAVRRKDWADATGRICWYAWPRVWKDVQPAALTFVEFFRKYLGIDLLKVGSTSYWQGAIFGVSKSRIRDRSREYYESLLSLVSKSVHPEEAYYFEQAWPYIFEPSWCLVPQPACSVVE